MPSAATVSAGSAGIATTGSAVTVTQTTDRAVVDWRSFDVGSGEQVHFAQPSASSAILNRIHDTKASQIDGRLTANGQVYLANSSGMVFGKGAKVDVGSLVATTADIGNAEFMKGGALHFNRPGRPDASIANAGSITVRQGGLAALVAPNVANSGVITAKAGTVALSAGDTAVVDFYGDNLLSVAVSDKVTRLSASNTGTLDASGGGTVLMTTAQAASVIDRAINMEGVADASSATDEGGVIFFGGQDADITVGAGAILNATGKTGGGEVHIGGEYQGRGDTPTARNTTIAKGASIDASATQTGNGGEVIVWADKTTVFAGDIKAKGGADRGGAHGAQTKTSRTGDNQTTNNGGFAEVSGKHFLEMSGEVDLSAPYGQKGTLLLDPANITVYGNVDPTFQSTDGSVNLNANLVLWLDASDLSTLFDADGDNALTGTGGANNGFSGTIASWRDKVGGIFAVTASGDPSIDNINGVSAVRFTNDIITMVDRFGGAASDFHAFTVIKETVPSNNFIINFNGNQQGVNPNERFSFHVPWDANRIIFFDAGGCCAINRAQILDPFPAGSSFLINGWKSSSSLINGLNLNGDLASALSASYAAATTTDGLRLGTGVIDHNIGEIFAYNTALPTNSRHLVDQYQSAKWGIALTPPGTGASEVAKATASDGYSVFTTRYLERLSQSANVSLQATNDITLDLKGDTLNFATAGRSLTLDAGNRITTASAGAITTNGGNITFTAAKGTLLNHNYTFNAGSGALTFNGTVNGAGNLTANAGSIVLNNRVGGATALGAVNLTAGGTVTLPSITASSITATTTAGNITGAGGLVTSGGNITLNAAQDLDLRSFGILSNNGNLDFDAGRDALLSTWIDSGTGSLTVDAARDITLTKNDLTTGLIGHWAFDEGAGGTAGDSSGSGNNGALTNGPTWSANTPFGTGRSLSFDGVNDYVVSGTQNGFNNRAITFSVWLNEAASPATWTQAIGDSTAGGAIYIHPTPYARFQLNLTGAGLITTDATMSNGVWTHYVGTWESGDKLRLYKDGTLASQTASVYTTTINGFIGLEAARYAGVSYFNGLLDDARIYNRALSTFEVAALAGNPTAWNTGTTRFTAGGALTMNTQGDTLSAGAHALNLTSGGAMTLGTLSAGSITARTTGGAADITLPSGKTLTASGAGDVITLASGGNFINNAGASALSASAGRWLVYSGSPATDTGGGLAADFSQYGCAYGSCSPQAPHTTTGNGFLYRYAPGGGGGGSVTSTTPEPEPTPTPTPPPETPEPELPVTDAPATPPPASTAGDVPRIIDAAPLLMVQAQTPASEGAQEEQETSVDARFNARESANGPEGDGLITYSRDLLTALGCFGEAADSSCKPLR